MNSEEMCTPEEFLEPHSEPGATEEEFRALEETFGVVLPEDMKAFYRKQNVDENGTVMYAVPSHQEKAIALAEEKLGKTRKEISDMCPREFYFDYLNWLLSLTGAIAVWNDDVSASAITVKQAAALRALKLNGLYKGKIPKIMPQDL